MTWVLASDTILYGLFFLCSLAFFLANLRSPRRLYFWLSVGAAACSLFCKETVIAMAALYSVIAIIKTRGTPRQRVSRALRAGAPYVATDLFYLCVRWAVFHAHLYSPKSQFAVLPSLQQAVFSSPRAFTWYMGKLVLPVQLAPAYDFQFISHPTVGMWLTIVAIAIGVAAVATLAVKKSQLVAVGAILIMLPMPPVLLGMHFFPFGESIHDRSLYIPCVGFCLLVGLGIQAMQRRRWNIGYLLAPLFLFFWCFCVTQQGFYANDYAMVTRRVDLAPNNERFLKLAAQEMLLEGNGDLTLMYAKRAYELNPCDDGMGNDSARSMYAEYLVHLGRWKEARPVLRELITDGCLPNGPPQFTKYVRQAVISQLKDADCALDRICVDGRHPEGVISEISRLAR